MLVRLTLVLLLAGSSCLAQIRDSGLLGDPPITITHGPILGHITESSVRVWARTKRPDTFYVQYQPVTDSVDWNLPDPSTDPFVFTDLANDNTGWTTLFGLESDTRYRYRTVNAAGKGPGGTFRTLPSAETHANPEYNPRGLFNFQFEFGSCASQNPANGIGSTLPTYTTMLREVSEEVHFAVMNGDWLYEENRDYSVESWRRQQGMREADPSPAIVTHAPNLVGVWENYKTYLERAGNLAEWHRRVPSYFTFDDHELINDIWGSGSTGRRDRRAVFRDIGVAAWYDYLGWANPTEYQQDVHFGTGSMNGGSNMLTDTKTDFTQLDLEERANLHVHWGTPTAGVDDMELDVDSTGVPNSRVYAIGKTSDPHQLRVTPAAVTTGRVNYSIGRRSYGKFRVGNCDYFLLDTRTHRQYHDTRQRDKPGLTILGEAQREWLKREMAASDADFFFLFSSVPFMIPHIGAGGYAMAGNKDESWTVFLDEREKLIDFWEGLDKPVFVLTGDLHNSFAIKITDRIWEFCSGPHNSVNHRLSDEGQRPTNGLYQFDQRPMDIRWSSFILDDIPRPQRLHPFYCVVQVNNVYNNPLALGEERWVAYQHPQVIFKYYDGRSGELVYAESVSTVRRKLTKYDGDGK